MKTIFGSRRHCYLARVSIFLITLVLMVGMVGCGTQVQYTLSVSSTSGGNVTHPGIGTFTYPAGAVVLLVAEPAEGYSFVNWTGNISTIADVNNATTTVIMNGHYFVTANFVQGQLIRNWYDLNAVRDDLGGYYILMNNLDSTTAGYEELASETANGGKGWQPIGNSTGNFTGTFDGQGHEIRDLFINRPGEESVGLFGYVGVAGVIKNAGTVDIAVTSEVFVGALVGYNLGAVRNSYSAGNVAGGGAVGGLVGNSESGIVSNCYATASVTGYTMIGGLVGGNDRGTVSNCYATGTVTGNDTVGGLVAMNWGAVSNCHATGSVIGRGQYQDFIGGLVGTNSNGGTISNCYAISSVTGGAAVGGLVGANFEGIVSDSYSTSSVTTGVGQYGEMIGGLAGDNDGTISNCYATGNSTGKSCVGGLMGHNGGTVINSYYNYDEVLINGENVITIGALFNADFEEWLANGRFLDVNLKLSKGGSYYLINNINDFKQLLAFGQNASLKFRLTNNLDLASQPNFYIPYLAGEFDGDGHIISDLTLNFSFVCGVGLFGCLAPGGGAHDLGTENVNTTGRYEVGGLVGSNFGFVTNSHTTANVTGNSSVGGLVGWNTDSGTVSNSYSISSVGGDYGIGGLIGEDSGTVSNSYAVGTVNATGEWGSAVGGLVGGGSGNVTNCYTTSNVTGIDCVGGLVGAYSGTVTNSYSTGNVTGNSSVGGLVGCYYGSGGVTNSFWDTETSGQAISAGGTGKNTTQMQDIDTFSGALWDITTVVNPSTRNLAYIWNIVNNVTYPFLSWQP